MSESTNKKQTFLHGAALLAIATAVVKVIGAFYKIPLKMVIGDQGYGYFVTSYDIYFVLLMISTTGLPVAMSRMISAASSLGHYNQVRRVYQVSRAVFWILGLGGSLLMMIFCHQLAAFQKQPNAWASILCLGPCCFLMGILSVYRGFFQGQGNMKPTSVGQVMEAVVKLVVGLAAAIVVLKMTNSIPLAAGAAILGVTLSCLASAIYMKAKFTPAYRELPQTGETPDSYRAITKELLSIAVPITIGAAGLQVLTVLETNLYMGQLLTVGGMTQDVADTTKGIYNMTQTVFNMPTSFIAPIAISVLPAITEHLTLKNDGAVRATEESAARVTALMSLPCTVGLLVLAGPVISLLGGYSGERLVIAEQLMALLAICIFPYSIIQYTNAVLQSHGFASIPVINTLAAGAGRLVVVYLMAGNPHLGILGVPLGCVLCYTAIAAMNLIAIRRLVPQRPKLMRNFLRPLLPALIMGAIVWLCDWGIARVLGETSRIIQVGVPIAVGVVVYFAAVVLCKAIKKEDCQLLPKGDRIARLLKL